MFNLNHLLVDNEPDIFNSIYIRTICCPFNFFFFRYPWVMYVGQHCLVDIKSVEIVQEKIFEILLVNMFRVDQYIRDELRHPS